VYALFFFAGHGFEYKSLNYMMPVDADVEKKPEQCICAQVCLLLLSHHLASSTGSAKRYADPWCKTLHYDFGYVPS